MRLPAPYPVPFWLQRVSLLRWVTLTMAHHTFACAVHRCLLGGIPGEEAARVRRLSPLQTLENQSQIWGIRCHSCTGREGLPPSWKLSYKTYVLRFTRESRFSFDQRIARILMCYPKSRRGQRR